ncbi:TetR/AcrR family transcriptional regulator (plasmid) [Streptomyces globosus]|uniref:TetR/AcrR family transcriptional regulator n=1 Tax=Streptomyces globosus TaxID=68209 RepID=A0A344UBP4_9ACTN|nr:TetR/AcrR family transcriptional regulator [Streptomyces globosus]
MRWRTALNAFDITFDDRLSATRQQPRTPWLHRSIDRPLFGGKDGLIRAVRDRAVAGLFQSLSAVQTSADPLADLYALAAAYRHWGRDHTHLYTVLFGGVQSFEPGGQVGEADPVRPLVEAIDRARAASLLDGEPTPIALSIWATLHGLVALELAGALDTAMADTAFRSAIHATLRGWTTPSVFRALRRTEPGP